jgi:hypothetical protein
VKFRVTAELLVTLNLLLLSFSSVVLNVCLSTPFIGRPLSTLYEVKSLPDGMDVNHIVGTRHAVTNSSSNVHSSDCH